jgi:phage FluMu gp28-like protein
MTNTATQNQQDGPATLAALANDYFTTYQKRWILDESQMKLGEKSRRIGWTYATSFRRVVKALRVPALDCWVSTRDMATAKEFVRDCLRWVRLANLVGKVTTGDEVIDIARNVSAQVITFPNRSRIYVLSSNPDVMAGKGGDIVLDEFALHKDQELLWQVAQPTASVWGFQIEVFSTHRGKGTLFNRFVTEARGSNKMGWSFHSVNIEQAVEQGLLDRINEAVAKRGGKAVTPQQFLERQKARCATEGQWNQEYMCRPEDDLGSLLPYALLTPCARSWDILRTGPTAPRTGRRLIGMDIARRVHKSVIWLIEEEGALWNTREIVTLHDVKLRDQRAALCDLFRLWECDGCAIDGTGLGIQLAEDAADDLGASLVQTVTFTPAVQNEMANIMLQTFQDIGILIPDHPDIEQALHKVRKAVTASGHITYVAEADESGHADEFWALALALLAARRCSGPARAMRIVEDAAPFARAGLLGADTAEAANAFEDAHGSAGVSPALVA